MIIPFYGSENVCYSDLYHLLRETQSLLKEDVRTRFYYCFGAQYVSKQGVEKTETRLLKRNTQIWTVSDGPQFLSDTPS